MKTTLQTDPSDDDVPSDPSIDDRSKDKTPTDVYHEPAHFGIFVALAAGMLGLFVFVVILLFMAA